MAPDQEVLHAIVYGLSPVFASDRDEPMIIVLRIYSPRLIGSALETAHIPPAS